MIKFKKLVSCAAAAAIAVTGLVGLIGSAADDSLITNGGPYEGDGTYISTYLKENYFRQSAFEIQYKFTEVGTPSSPQSGEADLGYGDTFEFLVFDTDWDGWNRTTVGPTGVNTASSSTPIANTVYTATVPISTIESALTTGGTPHGINIQTGAQLGTSKVEIVSLRLIESDTPYVQQEFTATGSWTKGTSSTMTINPKNAATIDANDWNIKVGGINLAGWKNPTVDVTVTYESTGNTVQAEIIIDGIPVDANYPRPSEGTYTYTTEIPNTTTSFLACYDRCTVTEIHVYDNVEGDIETSVTGKTAAKIADNMGTAWNLGNSLECTGPYDQVYEKATYNPKTTKKLIQAVKAAGFNTIRIPVSYLNKIGAAPDYTIDSDYLDRVQQVVDYAYNMGMYVIIDIHGDGVNSIKNYWIDISITDVTKASIMVDKFSKVWTQIAERFSDYDQRLVFESVNELMIAGNYSSSPDPAYANINALNQAFVTSVRTSGGQNTDRVLIIPGYNTDINLTVTPTGGTLGFAKPKDTASNRLMLSVHYMDPYDFTLNINGTNMWGTDEELSYIEKQFNKISSFADSLNMPVFLGEYGPIDKNNTAVRASYCYWLNYYAAANGIVTAYWDNGDIDTKGTALFDRTNNVITSKGKTIVARILKGYNDGK